MAHYDFDLITIGGGSGGVRASRMSAAHGARVALIEAGPLGGTCVNAGCIPKKLFSYASRFSDDFSESSGYGWTVGSPGFDWATLVANKDREIARLNGVYAKVLHDAGVTVIPGRAHLADAHTVVVGEQRLTSGHVLIATGGRAVKPGIPGAELGITSDQAFHLDTLPGRVVLLGGGYIAVEFASIFNGLGVDTTLVYRGEQLLRGFDDDLGRVLAEQLRQQGVNLLLNENVRSLERRGGGLQLALESGATIATDVMMFATGRLPNVDGLGLEAAGVVLAKNGAVLVDDFYRSSVPSVHAIGDVIDRIQLTPVAIAEGMALARTLFRNEPTALDYKNIPTAVFSHPHIGSVGLTEAQAREHHATIDVYRSHFRPLKATLSGSEGRVFMKLVVDHATDRVLGAHMVGDEAGEIIQGIAVALKCGATKAQFDATVGIHPTVAEEFVTLRA
ncbi:MAG: glutathione-disulfide reductase [Burkholderiales bacterium]